LFLIDIPPQEFYPLPVLIKAETVAFRSAPDWGSLCHPQCGLLPAGSKAFWLGDQPLSAFVACQSTMYEPYALRTGIGQKRCVSFFHRCRLCPQMITSCPCGAEAVYSACASNSACLSTRPMPCPPLTIKAAGSVGSMPNFLRMTVRLQISPVSANACVSANAWNWGWTGNPWIRTRSAQSPNCWAWRAAIGPSTKQRRAWLSNQNGCDARRSVTTVIHGTERRRARVCSVCTGVTRCNTVRTATWTIGCTQIITSGARVFNAAKMGRSIHFEMSASSRFVRRGDFVTCQSHAQNQGRCWTKNG